MYERASEEDEGLAEAKALVKQRLADLHTYIYNKPDEYDYADFYQYTLEKVNTGGEEKIKITPHSLVRTTNDALEDMSVMDLLTLPYSAFDNEEQLTLAQRIYKLRSELTPRKIRYKKWKDFELAKQQIERYIELCNQLRWLNSFIYDKMFEERFGFDNVGGEE